MLHIKKLSKKFDNNCVLKDISTNVKRGEVVVIIGPSGTGKSTLLRCINFLEKPDSGQIKIDDIEIDTNTITEKTIRQIRSKTSMVFQNYNLIENYNVIDNVMLHLIHVKKMDKEEAYGSAMYYLKQVHLQDKIDSYPFELSGGQQQRVAIARAMAMNPKVMLFDEPTSALDPTLTGEVMDVIRDLSTKDITMVIVTHSMSLAEDIADRIIFMSDGIIVEEGFGTEMLKNPKDIRLKKFLQLVENQ